MSMCRLFCSLSLREVSPYEMIFDSKYSIAKQAKVEGHADGWGFCYYENGALSLLTRKTRPLYENIDEAKELVKRSSSNISLFFVRKASNPLKIEKNSLLTIDATQPFSYKDITFIHNGSLGSPNTLTRALTGYHMRPRSLNDSEPYFIAFMRFMEEKKNVYKALKSAEQLINDTFDPSATEDKAPFSCLNVIISDGRSVYAYNRYTAKHNKSLVDPNRDYYKMCFKKTNKSLIISSEPTDDDKWEDLGDGKFLEASVENGKICCKVET